MSARTYEAVCDRLFRQNEFAIKLGIERIRSALDAEGSPDARFDTLLVAGTNGKGSVASLCHAALVGAGVRTGLFTSPHLVDVRERIRVDGVPIREDAFTRLGDQALARWGEGSDERSRLTYFELLTLMAARHFSDEGVEVAVVEVGLGGRLDASNALERALSVITPVSRDHEQYLGTGVPRIFAEKAAILRAGRPGVVCLPVGWEVADVERALGEGAARPLDIEGRDFGARSGEGGAGVVGEPEDIWVGDERLGGGWVPFVGAHQRRNAACALDVLRRYRELPGSRGGARLPEVSALPGLLARARWPGRWSDLGPQGPSGAHLVVDCAHNGHAAEVAAQALAAHRARRGGEAPTLVVGLSADKDAAAILGPLAPLVGACVATAADNPRALPAAEVARQAEALGLRAEIVEPARRAVEAALERGADVVALGSIYLVGEILAARGMAPEDLHVIG